MQDPHAGGLAARSVCPGAETANCGHCVAIGERTSIVARIVGTNRRERTIRVRRYPAGREVMVGIGDRDPSTRAVAAATLSPSEARELSVMLAAAATGADEAEDAAGRAER